MENNLNYQTADNKQTTTDIRGKYEICKICGNRITELDNKKCPYCNREPEHNNYKRNDTI